MRKRHQASTRRGKRLYGLTQKEAHDRSIKGWITRRLHNPGIVRSVSGSGSQHFAKLAAIVDEQKKRGRRVDVEQFRDLSPEQIDMLYRAEFVHRRRQRTTGAGWAAAEDKERVGEQANPAEFWQAMVRRAVEDVSYGREIQDPQMREYIQREGTPQDRTWIAAAAAKLKAHREALQAVRTPEDVPGRVDRDLGRVLDDTDLEYITPQAVEDHGKTVRETLFKQINWDPRQQIQPVDADHRRTIVATIRNAVAEQFGGEMTFDKPIKVRRTTKTGKEIEETQIVEATTHSFLHKASEKEIGNDLADAIFRSHTASSRDQRAAAAQEAQRLLSRAITYSEREYQARQQSQTLIEFEEKAWQRAVGAERVRRPPTPEERLEAIRKGAPIPHPLGTGIPKLLSDPWPRDPRDSLGIQDLYDLSGHHEQKFARLRWEKNRQRHKRILENVPDNFEKLPLRLPNDFKGTQAEREKIPTLMHVAKKAGIPVDNQMSRDEVITQIQAHVLGSRKPAYFDQWKRQHDFLMLQQSRTREAWRKGTIAAGVDNNGRLVGLTEKNQFRVRRGLAPNEVYEFLLHNSKKDAEGNYLPPYTKDVELFDKTTRFHYGKRGLAGYIDESGRWHRVAGLPGQLLDPTNDPDEIIDVRKKLKYDQAIAFHEGARLPVYDYKKPDLVDEVQFIPIRGLGSEVRTHTMPNGEGQKDVLLLRAAGGQTTVVDKDTFQGAQSTWKAYRKASEEGTPWRGPRPPEPVQERIDKQVQYVFIDPNETRLAPGHSDQVSFQLPGLGFNTPRVKAKGVNIPLPKPLRRRAYGVEKVNVGGVNIAPRAVEIGSRRYFDNLQEGNFADRTIGPYVREREAHQFRKRSVQARRALEDFGHIEKYDPEHEQVNLDDFAKEKGFNGERELKMFAGAATAAGFYNYRRSLTKGIIPNAFNKTFNQLKNIPPIKGYVKKKNIAWDDEVMTVNHAYIRPLVERMANFRYSLRHPLASPSGTSFGVDWGQFKYREHWISKDKREARRFDRMADEVKRTERTINYVRKHRNDKGILGAFRNWRSEPLLGSKKYAKWDIPEVGNQESFLGERIRIARQYLKNDFVDFTDPIGGGRVQEDVTPEMRRSAARFLHDVKKVRTHRAAAGPIPERTVGSVGSQWVDRVRNIDWQKAGQTAKSPAFLAGGGLAAAGVGHYLYYRHKQSKLPEEQRVRYYNKILPPAFNVYLPHVRATRWYRTGNSEFLDMIGLANRKIPVTWGARMQRHRVAMRPMDWHGYDGLTPNARIFGGLIKSGKTPGGKLAPSVFYENGDFRRTRKLGTHELYVKGKKVPGHFDLGKGWQKIERSPTNPNRLSQTDREDLVWAYKDTPQEGWLRSFFEGANRRTGPDPILDMLDDPDLVRRIRRQRAEAPKDIKDLYERSTSFVDSASELGAGVEDLSPSALISTPQARREWAFRTGAQDISAGGPANRETANAMRTNRFPGEDPSVRSRAGLNRELDRLMRLEEERRQRGR